MTNLSHEHQCAIELMPAQYTVAYFMMGREWADDLLYTVLKRVFEEKVVSDD